MRALPVLPLAVAFFTGVATAQSRAVRVNAAIDAGVVYLKGKQEKDGTFTGDHPEGVCALVLLTLIKSGVARTDPVVQKCIEYLRGKPYHSTYETAIRLLAWESLRDPKWVQEVELGTDALLDTYDVERGAWAYPQGTVDLSNTQYAVLGLWAAHRLGVKTPTSIWEGLAESTQRYQNGDGGFGYRLGDGSTGSMTTAGITVLLVAKDQGVDLDGRLDGSLARGWAYLERRFLPKGCALPEGNPVGATVYQHDHFHYYLYGIERICAIADRPRLGEHDWYALGADHLLATQGKAGQWGREADTCFSLLFLRRSTFTTIRQGPAPEIADGEASAKPARELRPRAETPFVRSWLVRGPFRDEVLEPMAMEFVREATVAPVSSGGGWMRFDSATPFVDLQVPLGEQDHCAGYAVAWLHAREDFRGYLWFSSDDGGRILIDGEEVFERNFRQRARADRQRIPIALSKGAHRVLVKIIEFVNGWGFYFRISDEQGRPPRGLIASLTSNAPGAPTWRQHLAQDAELEEIAALLPASTELNVDFSHPRDLQRIVLRNASAWDAPVWMLSDDERPAGAPQPHPGARGIFTVHPLGRRHPAQIVRSVKVPDSRHPRLSVRACAEAGAGKGASDWVLRLKICENGTTHQLAEQVISSLDPPTKKGWTTVEASLAAYAGREVLIVIECASGGPRDDWRFEHAFFDFIRVR